MKKRIFFFLLLAFSPLYAGVYTWVDEKGEKHFSDQPQPGAKQIELSKPTVYSPRDTQRRRQAFEENKRDAAAEEVPTGYRTLTITTPADDGSIRTNEGKVAVELELVPGLNPGDKFRIYMDGEEVSSGLTTTNIQLLNVDRGRHALYAIVVDDSGKELIRSDPVTFQLHKISVINHPKAIKRAPIN